ncbi:SH3 domain-containing protein [Treponema brennaborense]|uniref:SH3 type 3 domain protein n=1 Tax=Treponema brennaborense (strain DSM 12168 / CIP 105900 / DD5/3) TaxID=906968 RepID=F4LJF4_TREBD|nr:SH3 domain-containing protein [Treponema brennaborense]AEE17399.1 SH3 type 3 domain protein [Treponema brennaborense DSM 12168]
MKRNLFFVIFIFIQVLCFGYDIKTIDGSCWAAEDIYKYLMENKHKQLGRYAWSLRFDISNGIFQNIETRAWKIDEYLIKSNNTIEITISVEGKETGWYRVIDCIFLDEDTMYLMGDLDGTGIVYGKENLYYRLSGPAKIPQNYALLNDTRVRLRTKPNLQSDTWGFLNTGDKVRIKDKTADKQKIANMNDYWYKVETDGYPDGWIYGAFLDIKYDAVEQAIDGLTIESEMQKVEISKIKLLYNKNYEKEINDDFQEIRTITSDYFSEIMKEKEIEEKIIYENEANLLAIINKEMGNVSIYNLSFSGIFIQKIKNKYDIIYDIYFYQQNALLTRGLQRKTEDGVISDFKGNLFYHEKNKIEVVGNEFLLPEIRIGMDKQDIFNVLGKADKVNSDIVSYTVKDGLFTFVCNFTFEDNKLMKIICTFTSR